MIERNDNAYMDEEMAKSGKRGVGLFCDQYSI